MVSCIKESNSNEFYKKFGCKFLEEYDFNLKNTIYKENFLNDKSKLEFKAKKCYKILLITFKGDNTFIISFY